MVEMMKPASLNRDVSLEVFQASPERFAKQMCYANVYRAITDNWLRATSEGWKVAYGYYSVTTMAPVLLARHCFILDGNGLVIDPTIFTHTGDKSYQYFTMYVFDDLHSYFSAVAESEYYTALEQFLRPYKEQAYHWAVEHGYYLWD